MGNENEKKAAKAKSKKNFFKTLRGEFRKIVWPGKDTVKKETVSVVLSTAFLGVLIACLDGLIKLGIAFVQSIGV